MSQSGIFDVKLRELEWQYSQMLDCLRLCRAESHGEIRQALETVREAYLEHEHRLQNSVNRSRSPAVAALSKAQLGYSCQVRQILQDDLPRCLHGENSTPAQDGLEAAGLYGEFAIDFAVQSMRYALLAILSAMDAQLNYEEEAR